MQPCSDRLHKQHVSRPGTMMLLLCATVLVTSLQGVTCDTLPGLYLPDLGLFLQTVLNITEGSEEPVRLPMYFRASLDQLLVNQTAQEFWTSLMDVMWQHNISESGFQGFELQQEDGGIVRCVLMVISQMMIELVEEVIARGEVIVKVRGSSFQGSLEAPENDDDEPAWLQALQYGGSVVAFVVLAALVANRKRLREALSRSPQVHDQEQGRRRIDDRGSPNAGDKTSLVKGTLDQNGLHQVHYAVIKDDMPALMSMTQRARFDDPAPSGRAIAEAQMGQVWLMQTPSPESTDSRYDAVVPGSHAQSPEYTTIETLGLAPKAMPSSPKDVPMMRLDALERISALFDIQDSAGNTSVALAACVSSANTLRFCLQCGAGVNTSNQNGRTPLHLACSRVPANVDIVDMLLAANANANIKDSAGFTPLVYACQMSNASVVRSLLRAGASTSWVDDLGCSLLTLLAKQDFASCVPDLIEADPSILNSADRTGWTACHWAAAVGSDRALGQLVQHGADVSAKNMRGETPLHVAAREGNCGAIDVLMRMNDLSPRQQLLYLLERNGDGYSPFDCAEANGHSECASLLLVAVQQLGDSGAGQAQFGVCRDSPPGSPLSPHRKASYLAIGPTSASSPSSSEEPKSSKERKSYFRERRQQKKAEMQLLQDSVATLEADNALLSDAVRSLRAEAARLRSVTL